MKLYTPFTFQDTKTSTGDPYDDLESSEVAAGLVYEVRLITVVNMNSNFTKILVAVRTPTGIFDKLEQINPLANTLYWANSKILIPPGHSLLVRCYGCVSGDLLKMWYEGFVWEV